MLASQRINLWTGGEVATTYPPMMMIAICIVNGMRLQKPSPKYLTRSRMAMPMSNPATKTTIRPASAKTKASGNHRCDQSAKAMPSRASPTAESPPVSCPALRCGPGAICSPNMK